jgi:hypothetical protein
MTDTPVPDQDHPAWEGEMLTTGEAAAVIGYGTTRRQVIAMIGSDPPELLHVRLGDKRWARIPRSAALAKRRELEAQLAGQERSRADQTDPVDGHADGGNEVQE